MIYDTLLGYAATHAGWTDVDSTVQRLETETDRQITLSTDDGRQIAATHPGTSPPDRPAAVLDPLGTAAGSIDPRAVGP